MSRSLLVLHRLDRPALKDLSARIEALLIADDAPALAQLIGVAPERLSRGERVVDAFLLPDDGAAADLYVALRRTAKQHALSPCFASESLALEGRLRAFEPLREDPVASAAIDRLLDPQRLPWYLRATGATGGWLDDARREQLARRFDRLSGALTPELRAFGLALAAAGGDVVAHDRV